MTYSEDLKAVDADYHQGLQKLCEEDLTAEQEKARLKALEAIHQERVRQIFEKERATYRQAS